MVFTATKEDLTQVIDLWNECFKVEKDFTDYFFSKVYDNDKTLVIKDEGKIVSMLQMLNFKSSLGGATYIYGVATAKTHRKKGLADKLLMKSFEISKKQGDKFSILIPENESLFGFYEKYDYKPLLNCKFYEISNESVNDISRKMSHFDVEQVLRIYNNACKGDFYIKREPEFVKNLIDLYANGALKYMQNSEVIGYSFGIFKDGVYEIDEFFSQNDEKCLKSFKNVKGLTYGHDIKKGAIKSLCDKEIKDGYLNLMYN